MADFVVDKNLAKKIYCISRELEQVEGSCCCGSCSVNEYQKRNNLVDDWRIWEWLVENKYIHNNGWTRKLRKFSCSKCENRYVCLFDGMYES